MSKWQSKLTKAQRAHLREWGPNTLAGLARQKGHIERQRIAFGPTAGCRECEVIIARLEAKGVRLPA